MKVFEAFKIRFEKPNWKNDPELGLIDTVLEKHPHLLNIVKEDIVGQEPASRFGRKDTPSIEQIVRAAIYKELKGLNYRELEYHQEDSRICELFVKIDVYRPYSFQAFQKYISRIQPESLQQILVELNKIAISEGLEDIEKLRPVMNQVYDVAYRKEIKGEKVPNREKVFSIYEQHTDIIIKGGRKPSFGHKISLATGKSNLVLDCQVLKGNPADKTLYGPTLDRIIDTYGKIPRDTTDDGGYASLGNMEYAKSKGVINVVFNKIVGSLKNQVSSMNMETRLKKWRSGIEANISNIKHGFRLQRSNWKGWGPNFQAKVLWSIIAL